MPTYSITPLPVVTWTPTTTPADVTLSLNVPLAAAGHGWSILRFRMVATLQVTMDAFPVGNVDLIDFAAQQPDWRIFVTIGGVVLAWFFFTPITEHFAPASTATYHISGEASGTAYVFRDWRKERQFCQNAVWKFHANVSPTGFNFPHANYTLTVSLLEVDVQDVTDANPDCTVGGSLEFISAAILDATIPTAGNTFDAIEADSEQGRYYVGVGQVIKQYHASDWSVARESPAHSNVDTWKRLRWDARRSALAMLGKQGVNTYKFCWSPDGGMSQTEIFSVTANSAALERDSEAGQFLGFYTDASNKLFLRRSKDGGLTYEAADAVNDTAGSQLTGTIIDCAQNPRARALAMTFTTGGATGIYVSTDAGKTFALKVS